MIKTNFAVANELAKAYLNLNSEISKLEKQKDELKQVLIAEGAFETDSYVFDVKEVELNRVVGAEVLLEKLGPVIVEEKDLIKHSTYKKLTVKSK